MSLLGKLWKPVRGILKQAAPIIGGIAGAAVGGPVGGRVGTIIGGGVASSGGGGGIRPPALPGGAPAGGSSGGGGLRVTVPIGRAVAGAAAASAVTHVVDEMGNVHKVSKRRRRKGISAKDLQSFKRVARLIDKYAAPVHKLRKSSIKH